MSTNLHNGGGVSLSPSPVDDVSGSVADPVRHQPSACLGSHAGGRRTGWQFVADLEHDFRTVDLLDRIAAGRDPHFPPLTANHQT